MHCSWHTKSMKVLNDVDNFTSWQRVLIQAVDKIYLLLGVCALPALLASLSRIPITGFQVSMVVHIILIAALIYIAIRRKHFNIQIKLYFLTLLSAGVTLVGLYNWGLLGNGFLWSMMLIVFITLCFGLKQGVIWAIILTIYATTIGALYVSGTITTQVAPETYVTSYSGWATALFGSLLPLIVVSVLIGTLYETAKNMIYKLEEQRIKITTLAERDSLTGLYNARMFHEFIAQSLERSKRHNSWVYVFNMDLNGFKTINDQYGHQAGDLILKHAADQMLKVTRAEDTLCRVGGDEFLMLSDYPEKPDSAKVKKLINRLKSACSTAITYDNVELSVTVSVGYAAYNANQTPKLKNDDDILKLADRAMYKDKKEFSAQRKAERNV
ncbi:GGDEF domain-containing protein [Kangiella sp. HD9-110m-PIT-SAG06]|nr:GGDEF domain-containing protein [Kangiella sp. HD9-110m-PIT-SAG06]RDX36769.1 GGDEF domain-containing protein [Kangiella sp. HD9-110m-PIT-SAG07]